MVNYFKAINNSQFPLIVLITLSVLFVPNAAFGNDKFNNVNFVNVEEIVEQFVADENKYTFFGLSSYYNNVNYYIVNKAFIDKIEINKNRVLQEGEWLVIANRLKVLAVKSSGLSVDLIGSTLSIDKSMISATPLIKVIPKSELSLVAPELDQIRYIHLWKPLAWLAKVIESALVLIQKNINSNWGWSIVIFSVLLKLLLLPVGVMTVKFQRRVSQVQAKLAPKLAEIKTTYDGEEAHNLLMAAYKELGVSPFYTLKPMLGSFIQVPILIAVFNVLGEVPQLDGQSFLWIENLAFPDAIGHFPFSIPMFGSTISLLPIIMTAITMYSTVIFQNRHALDVEIKRQKRNLYFMAAVFFVLFYPFPAAMVLYWTLANILQTIQQQLIKI